MENLPFWTGTLIVIWLLMGLVTSISLWFYDDKPIDYRNTTASRLFFLFMIVMYFLFWPLVLIVKILQWITTGENTDNF